MGKTCVLVRFKDGTFLSGSFISTVGIDFRVRLVCFKDGTFVGSFISYVGLAFGSD